MLQEFLLGVIKFRFTMVAWILAIVLSLFVQVHSVERWVNCIENQTCHPRYYYEPKNLEELRTIIKAASSQGYPVKAIGSGFSISDIGCTDGCLLNLKNINRILSIDLKQKRVRVEAGITLRELNEQLAAHHLALSNQAAIDQISLGGAVSTAAHGTGPTGTLSSFITEIELITADGTLHQFSDHSDPEAFAAAKVSLGSLGVIYALTIQCEQLFYLNASTSTVEMATLFEQYDELKNSRDFFQFSWNVETGKVLIHRWTRIKSQEPPSIALASYKALPWHVIDKNDRDLFSEIAILLSSFPQALEKVSELCKRYAKLGAAIAEITIRFVEKEDAYLSPAGNGPVAYIAFSLSDKDKYLEFYKEFEDALIHFGGRPHWGKLHFLNEEKARFLYGRNLEKFIRVKQRLDPQGTFSNAFTDRILLKSNSFSKKE